MQKRLIPNREAPARKPWQQGPGYAVSPTQSGYGRHMIPDWYAEEEPTTEEIEAQANRRDQALQDVRRSNMDMTGWIEFFTKGLATQLIEVKERGELAIQQDILVRSHQLSERQALALGLALEHRKLTIGGFQELCPGVHRRTLQRDLKILADQGLLLRCGRTNQVEYFPGHGVA